MSFNRAITNSCTCSPARVTMLTGLYPAQHGVTEVLETCDSGRPFCLIVSLVNPHDVLAYPGTARWDRWLPAGRVDR